MKKRINKLLLILSLGLAVPIALLSTGTFTKSTASNVISDGTFERGLSPWKKVPKAIKTCCNHSLKIVNSPTRAGNRAVQFTLNQLDGVRRAELRSVNAVPANSEAWYGFSVYLPKSWVIDRGANDIIAQYGAPPDRKLGETHSRGGPPLALVVSGKNFHIVRRWDTNPTTTPKSVDNEERIDIGAYKTGVWTDFVIHIKWSYKHDGFIQVYKNGKLVVDKKVSTNRNDQGGIFFNTGIYKPKFETQPEESDVDKRVLYFDEIRIGQANAKYQDVAPKHCQFHTFCF